MKYIITFLAILFAATLMAQTPFELSWRTDGRLVAAGTGLLIGGQLTLNTMTPLSQKKLDGLSRKDVNRLDRFAIKYWSPGSDDVSDMIRNGFFVLPLAFLIPPRTRTDFLTISVMYLQVMGYNRAIGTFGKGLFPRPRPYVYSKRAEVSIARKSTTVARQSFYSGHATTSFSSAAFFSYVYSAYFPNSKSRYWMTAGSFGAAATVAVLRVKAGNHFPSDAIIGSVIGTAIGLGIPALHRKNNDRFSAIPVLSPDGLGVSLGLSLD